MLRDLLLIIAGGGLCSAILKFIEFLIGQWTHNKERKEDKQENIEDLREELLDHLKDENTSWKEKYCDPHRESINHLTEITDQLTSNIILLTNQVAGLQDYNIAVGEAIRGVVRGQIIHSANKFIERKGITHEEISTLKSMYYPYQKLGGEKDVEVETAFEKCTEDIELITKAEADRRDAENKRKLYSGSNET